MAKKFSQRTDGIEIPWPFLLQIDGVWWQPPKPKIKRGDPIPEPPLPIRVAGPCWVSAQSRRYDSEMWGFCIHWRDEDGDYRERNIQKRNLFESTASGRAVIADLVASGLAVVDGYELHVVSYFKLFQSIDRLRWTDQIGWLDADEMTYVMLQQVIQ